MEPVCHELIFQYFLGKVCMILWFCERLLSKHYFHLGLQVWTILFQLY